MANFEQAHRIVMANEGGYANDPDDLGGETYKGIARKMHPDWNGWPDVDRIKATRPANLDAALQADAGLQQKVLAFFKAEFWDVMKLDELRSQAIAQELYDTGVNMGTGRAGTFLQVALNISNRNGRDYPDLKVDGIIGDKTVATLNQHGEPWLILKILNVQQGQQYISRCESNPTQEKFVRSWFSRVGL